jgi:hypothetical protein
MDGALMIRFKNHVAWLNINWMGHHITFPVMIGARSKWPDIPQAVVQRMKNKNREDAGYHGCTL